MTVWSFHDSPRVKLGSQNLKSGPNDSCVYQGGIDHPINDDVNTEHIYYSILIVYILNYRGGFTGVCVFEGTEMPSSASGVKRRVGVDKITWLRLGATSIDADGVDSRMPSSEGVSIGVISVDAEHPLSAITTNRPAITM